MIWDLYHNNKKQLSNYVVSTEVFMYRAMFLFAAACGSTPVYRVSSIADGGIPFPRRIAVHEETIQLAQRWFRVDVTMKLKVPTIESKDKVLWNDAEDTTTVYFQGEDAAEKVKNTLKLLGVEMGYEEARDTLQAIQRAGEVIPPAPVSQSELWKELVAWKTVPGQTAGSAMGNAFENQVIVDQCTIDHVASSEEQYINVDVPRGGSANATIKFAEDGTLGEITGGAADQLPKTIVDGLGTLLTAAGDFGGTALTARASIAAAQIAAGAARDAAALTLSAIAPRTPPELPRKEPPGKVLLGLTAKVSPGRHVYSIGLQWPFAQFRHDHNNKGEESPRPSSSAADVCSNPCFSMDPLQRIPYECRLKFATIDGSSPAVQAPETKNPPAKPADK